MNLSEHCLELIDRVAEYSMDAAYWIEHEATIDESLDPWPFDVSKSPFGQNFWAVLIDKMTARNDMGQTIKDARDKLIQRNRDENLTGGWNETTGKRKTIVMTSAELGKLQAYNYARGLYCKGVALELMGV